jgi:hypothetical protein
MRKFEKNKDEEVRKKEKQGKKRFCKITPFIFKWDVFCSSRPRLNLDDIRYVESTGLSGKL